MAAAPAPSGFILLSFSHPSPEMNSVPSDLSVKLPRSSDAIRTEPNRFRVTPEVNPAVPSGGTPS